MYSATSIGLVAGTMCLLMVKLLFQVSEGQQVHLYSNFNVNFLFDAQENYIGSLYCCFWEWGNEKFWNSHWLDELAPKTLAPHCLPSQPIGKRSVAEALLRTNGSGHQGFAQEPLGFRRGTPFCRPLQGPSQRGIDCASPLLWSSTQSVQVSTQ